MAHRKRKITGTSTLPCGCTIKAERVFVGNGAEARRVQKLLAHQIGRDAAAHVCPPKAPEPAPDEADPAP